MKKTLLLVCLLTVGRLTLFAQTEGPRAVHTTEKSAIHVPPQDAPQALSKIYNNLGKPTPTFTMTPTPGLFRVQTPTSASRSRWPCPLLRNPTHVSQVQMAVQYFSGTNQVNLSLYGDSSGAPGTLLAGPVTVKNLQAAGTCCTLALANFTPVAVTAGTRYWVVADTPVTGTGSDFDGSWDWVARPVILLAGNHGAGWYGFNGDALPAGEVLGTIP